MRFLLLLLPIFVFSATLKDLQSLSPKQYEILYRTYFIGKKFNLEWTLTAIAWKESNFGKYTVNSRTGDYGVFQINLNTYKRRFHNEITITGISDQSIISLLRSDFNTGLLAAIEEIHFWKYQANRSWYDTWASYNDGTVLTSVGHAYADDILHRISLLQKFIRTP